MSDLKSEDLRAGDVVEYLPDGDIWVVLWAEGDRLMAAGWPVATVDIGNCALREKVTDAAHAKLMERIRNGDHPYKDRVLRLYAKDPTQ